MQFLASSRPLALAVYTVYSAVLSRAREPRPELLFGRVAELGAIAVVLACVWPLTAIPIQEYASYNSIRIALLGAYLALFSPADLMWHLVLNSRPAMFALAFAGAWMQLALAGHALSLGLAAPSVWLVLIAEPLVSHALAVSRRRSPAGAWAHAAWAWFAVRTVAALDEPDAVLVHAPLALLLGWAVLSARLVFVSNADEDAAGARLRELGEAARALGAAESKTVYNAALFTVVAPSYDFITRALSFGQDAHWKAVLMRLLPATLQSASAVAVAAAPAARRSRAAAASASAAGSADKAPLCVDIACGTGDLCFALGAKYPHARVLGVDLTPRMIELATATNRAHNVSFVVGDMCALDVAPGSVALLTGSYALRNAPQLDRALAEVARVLQPEGVAAFLDFSKPAGRLGGALSYALLWLWGALWGLLVHGDPRVYAYIADSLATYPDRHALPAVFAAAGLRIRHREQHLFGMIELTLASKEGPTRPTDAVVQPAFL